MDKNSMEFLRQSWKDSGLKAEKIAENMGISRQCLYNKLNGNSGWTVFQFKQFCETVGIPKKMYMEIIEKNFNFKVG